MKRMALAFSFSAVGCLICCAAPVVLLLIGGSSVAAAIAEWRACYRNPLSLGVDGGMGSLMLFLGARTWFARRRAKHVTVQSQRSPQPQARPIACALAPGDLKTRLAELADISQSALAGVRREDLTLHLRYFPEAEERVREMVKKERECCAFLTFEIESTPPFLAVRITAPETAREAVQDIYAQFTRTESIDRS